MISNHFLVGFFLLFFFLLEPVGEETYSFFWTLVANLLNFFECSDIIDYGFLTVSDEDLVLLLLFLALFL